MVVGVGCSGGGTCQVESVEMFADETGYLLGCDEVFQGFALMICQQPETFPQED